MKKTIKRVGMLLVCMTFSFFSCKKKTNDPVNNPPSQNEEELITTVRLTFTDTTGSVPILNFEFQDIDGPGGMNPTKFDSIVLKKDIVYHLSIQFLNESVTPSENITSEIASEGVDHLLCFVSSINAVNITKADMDDNNLAIGLHSFWKANNLGEGTLLLTLKHQPGIKTGDCSVGETDVELNFPFKVIN